MSQDSFCWAQKTPDAETETFHNRYLNIGLFFPTDGKLTYTNNNCSPRWPLWTDRKPNITTHLKGKCYLPKTRKHTSDTNRLQAVFVHFSPTQSHKVLSGSFLCSLHVFFVTTFLGSFGSKSFNDSKYKNSVAPVKQPWHHETGHKSNKVCLYWLRRILAM